MKKATLCLLCKASLFSKLVTMSDRMFDIPGTFTWKQCKSCGLVFLDPQPGISRLRRHYPTKGYFAYNKEGKGGLRATIREYVIKHIYEPTLLSRILVRLLHTSFAIPKYRANGKILDLGCGTGDILTLLKNLGWDVYGIDIDRGAIQIAKTRGLRKVRVGTYKSLRLYPDSYFDVIRLYHVIEHVDDPLLCLQLLYRKVKPDGEVIMSTPNFDSPIQKIFGPYWGNFDTPRHLFLFTPQTLTLAATLSKFTVSSMQYASAQGIVGSMQNFTNTILKRRRRIFETLPVILFFHPIEWLLDTLGVGDMFTIKLVK